MMRILMMLHRQPVDYSSFRQLRESSIWPVDRCARPRGNWEERQIKLIELYIHSQLDRSDQKTLLAEQRSFRPKARPYKTASCMQEPTVSGWDRSRSGAPVDHWPAGWSIESIKWTIADQGAGLTYVVHCYYCGHGRGPI